MIEQRATARAAEIVKQQKIEDRAAEIVGEQLGRLARLARR